MRWSLLVCLVALLVCSFQKPPEPGQALNHATIRATFVDAEGKPVVVEYLSRCWPGAEFPTKGAADGTVESRIEWPIHKQQTWYEGSARVFGFAAWSTSSNLVPDRVLDLGRIRLRPGGAASGLVLDHEGKPLAGAGVTFYDADKAPRSEPFDREADMLSSGVVDGGRTREDGRFQLVGLPPGRYWAVAKHQQTWPAASAVIEVSTAKDIPVGTLHLDPLPAEFRIEGVVRDPDDKPVEGAKVSTSVHVPKTLTAAASEVNTDAQGRFILYLARRTERPVNVSVEPSVKSLEQTTLEGVMPGARGLVIRLDRMRPLRLKVIDPSGAPVESYGVSVTAERGDFVREYTAPIAHHPGGLATVWIPDAHVQVGIVRAPGWMGLNIDPLGPGPLPELVEVRLR